MTNSPRIPPFTPRRIEILAFPRAQLLDIAGPLQVFATANALAGDETAPYETRVIAKEPGSITVSAGLTLATEPLPSVGTPADTLIVAGGKGVHDAATDAALADWLRQRAGHVRRLASVCTGAFLLGAVGLLDGKRVATHWDSCARLAEAYPAAKVEPEPIFIEDGALWTSAGVTAGIDLALAMVERDLGRAPALAIARDLVVFLKRPGGQAQFSTALALQHAEGRFGDLHAWMIDNPDANLTVPALAGRAGMSERTFLRRYREETGATPARAVEQLRIEAARRLLEDTATPVKRVAAQCGFGSEETLRRTFLRHLAVSPQAYRERFADAGQ
ncbi:transcriptional regulator, AraC family with amidase-like domain [Faunimonas pinastri]|uniref:Transcriptional regulator, AraC family with amidase-like domain n=1 Tax=Faunimonas pinastri TaxID=1855383 RepID=A0A1H9HW63_9HYPH|nr:GlxA family transcriptional regulator [Faunimonas pinastri]SEQ66492.1 transcriptional regulator, AraC family with amidase-like domain [Faunimonas pinastri]